jgi:ankyrin repeat protein
LSQNSSFKISGPTALFVAANFNDNDKAILFLYDKYLKLDSLNMQHIEDLLFISITKDKRKLFHRILEHPEYNANRVMGYRDYPIFFALFADDKYYVSELLKSGADIDIITTIKTKLTPLQYAIATNRFNMFKTLVQKGANIYKPYKANGTSNIEFLFKKRRNRNSFYKMGLKRYKAPFDNQIADLLLKEYRKPFTLNEKLLILNYSYDENKPELFERVFNQMSNNDLIKSSPEEVNNLYKIVIKNSDCVFRCNCATHFGDVVPLKKE